MGTYRISRNLEASIIQYLEENVATAFSGTTVEKTFKRIYGIPVNTFQKQGAICVRLSDTTHEQAQIGDNSTLRLPLVLIDVFGTSDGFRLDLKDYLISILKNGMPYYEYETSAGVVSSKIQNGRIRVTNIDDTEVNLNVDKSLLDVQDRFRHLLSLNLSFGRIEV